MKKSRKFKKILITGVNGSVGSYLFEYLNKKKLTNDFYYIETKLYPSKIKKVKFNKILYCDRCYVNSIEWNKLLKFSQKTYVKESKISKEKGAGY